MGFEFSGVCWVAGPHPHRRRQRAACAKQLDSLSSFVLLTLPLTKSAFPKNLLPKNLTRCSEVTGVLGRGNFSISKMAKSERLACINPQYKKIIFGAVGKRMKRSTTKPGICRFLTDALKKTSKNALERSVQILPMYFGRKN